VLLFAIIFQICRFPLICHGLSSSNGKILFLICRLFIFFISFGFTATVTSITDAGLFGTTGDRYTLDSLLHLISRAWLLGAAWELCFWRYVISRHFSTAEALDTPIRHYAWQPPWAPYVLLLRRWLRRWHLLIFIAGWCRLFLLPARFDTLEVFLIDFATPEPRRLILISFRIRFDWVIRLTAVFLLELIWASFSQFSFESWLLDAYGVAPMPDMRFRTSALSRSHQSLYAPLSFAFQTLFLPSAWLFIVAWVSFDYSKAHTFLICISFLFFRVSSDILLQLHFWYFTTDHFSFPRWATAIS